MCGLCAPVVWGILGASMPRSGGEYIYNSRIINPVIAMGASFANVIAVTYWNIFIATWIANPALAILGEYMGWPGLTNFANSKGGMVVCTTACFVLSFLAVAFGMSVFRRIQRPLVAIGIGGPSSWRSRSRCLQGELHRALERGGRQVPLAELPARSSPPSASGRAAMPRTWNWGETIGVTERRLLLFIYAYALVYLSGEVKRPDKTDLQGELDGGAGAGRRRLLDVLRALPHGRLHFVSASAYNDLFGGVKGYNFPFSTSYMTLSWLASGSNWFIAIIAVFTFLLTSYWLIVVDLMLVPRAMFAWGMDRMGPKWFTDISPRCASPVKLYGFITVVQIVLTAVVHLWLQTTSPAWSPAACSSSRCS